MAFEKQRPMDGARAIPAQGTKGKLGKHNWTWGYIMTAGMEEVRCTKNMAVGSYGKPSSW